MSIKKFTEIKLVENFNEEKMLEFLNDGFEIMGFNSTTYGATNHYFLMIKRSEQKTTLKGKKVKDTL